MTDIRPEWQVYASFLPDLGEDGKPNAATEFAFIEGQPFVNAAKHEEVVNRHAAKAERLRDAYLGARRQAECVLGVAERVVPDRHGDMHPNLRLLYDVVEAMRAYFEVDDEAYGDLGIGTQNEEGTCDAA